MQGLAEDYRNERAEEIRERAEMENASVLSRKALDEVYMNKAELESRPEGSA